jgi:hypothetical protein
MVRDEKGAKNSEISLIETGEMKHLTLEPRMNPTYKQVSTMDDSGPLPHSYVAIPMTKLDPLQAQNVNVNMSINTPSGIANNGQNSSTSNRGDKS